MIKLPFTFTENTKYAGQSGYFEISEVDIQSDSLDVTLYIDGKRYDGGISTFTDNNVSADFLFENVLNSFLRVNTREFTFSKEWEENFAYIAFLCVFDDKGLLREFPQLNCGSFDMYKLDLAVPERRFYSHDDDFILMGKEGEIITNVEAFWQSALEEDLKSCLEGKQEILYMSDNIKTFIEEGLGR